MTLNLRMRLDTEGTLTIYQGSYMTMRYDITRASASNYKGTSERYYQCLTGIKRLVRIGMQHVDNLTSRGKQYFTA